MHVETFFDRNLGDLDITRNIGSVEEGESRKLHMNDIEKSDSVVVPMKPANKGGNILAEQVEGRPLTKGNTYEATADRTQCRGSASCGLVGVRKAARKHRGMQFTALLDPVTVGLLRESYLSLKRRAAPGIDGLTWQEYGSDLEGRLEVLHQQIHSGRYRAKLARRVFIPKADGAERALSI